MARDRKKLLESLTNNINQSKQNEDKLIMTDNIVMEETTPEEINTIVTQEEVITPPITFTISDAITPQSSIILNPDTIQTSNFIVEEKETLTPKKVSINIRFDKPAVAVESILDATGQKDKIIASNKELRLISGRTYFIPVNSDQDSDNFITVKLFSDIADLIDVRYIKNGFACVRPLRHNITLKDEQRLAVLY